MISNFYILYKRCSTEKRKKTNIKGNMLVVGGWSSAQKGTFHITFDMKCKKERKEEILDRSVDFLFKKIQILISSYRSTTALNIYTTVSLINITVGETTQAIK